MIEIVLAIEQELIVPYSSRLVIDNEKNNTAYSSVALVFSKLLLLLDSNAN